MPVRCMVASLACLQCSYIDSSPRTNPNSHSIDGDIVGVVWMKVVSREETSWNLKRQSLTTVNMCYTDIIGDNVWCSLSGGSQCSSML